MSEFVSLLVVLAACLVLFIARLTLGRWIKVVVFVCGVVVLLDGLLSLLHVF